MSHYVLKVQSAFPAAYEVLFIEVLSSLSLETKTFLALCTPAVGSLWSHAEEEERVEASGTAGRDTR